MTEEVVYVGGDSYTAGEDIADYLIDGYNSYTTIEMQDAMSNLGEFIRTTSNWIKRRQDLFKNNVELTSRHIADCQKYRWSSVLDNLISKKVMNVSSLGGSSMYAIGYRAVHDIIELQKKGHKVTDVILQITNAMRFTFFSNQLNELGELHRPYQLKTLQMDSKLKPLIAEVEDMGSLRVFYDLYMAESAIEKLIGKRPIIVDSVFFKKSVFRMGLFVPDNYMKLNGGFLVDYINELNGRIKLSMIDCIQHDNEPVWTTNFHLDRTVHKRFAERIAETYFNE